MCVCVCVHVIRTPDPNLNQCTARGRAYCVYCMLCDVCVCVFCVCVVCVCSCVCMHAFSHDPASGGTTRCPELFFCMHTCTLRIHVYVRTCIHAPGGSDPISIRRGRIRAFDVLRPNFSCTNACLSSMGLRCLSHGELSQIRSDANTVSRICL